jgi:beta-alanine degradation protein BauB
VNDTELTRRTLLLALPALATLRSGSASAQDPVRQQPGAFKVVLENEHVRVLEFNSRPGMAVCGSGMHSHPAHLTVVLTAGRVRIRTPDGKSMTTDETPPGLVFWSDAETHEVENVGGRDMRSLIVELKSLPA